MNKMKLLCFPYAGGDSRAYTAWKPYLSDKIDLHTIELPGRGARYQEPLATTIDQMILNSLTSIMKVINSGSYMVFGHSMGSTLVYALVLQIINHDWPQPSHVIFSGGIPPYANIVEPPISHTPDKEFIEHILSLDGTPREVFDNKDLRNLFLPILRADYLALEDYNPPHPPIPFPCNISVFYGRDDATTAEGIHLWDKIAGRDINYKEFDGGHFFINKSASKVAEEINRLCRVTEEGR